MRTLTLLMIFIVANLCSDGQTKDTTDIYDRLAELFHYASYDYDITKNEDWAKNSKTITFEKQGEYHSTYLAINDDSTFTFLSIYETGEFLTIGSWTKIDDTTYCLNWDKGKTIEICKDAKVYYRYYKYSSPLPLKISNWIFFRNKSKLLSTCKLKGKSRKITDEKNGL